MPQLIFRGIKEQEVCELSNNLCKKLSAIMETKEDWFIFEYVNRKTYCMGDVASAEIIVDVFWFDRGQDIKDLSAKEITSYINEMGYLDVAVVFHALEKQDYYENGVHY